MEDCYKCAEGGSNDYQLANTSFSSGEHEEESFGHESYEQLVSQNSSQVEIKYDTNEDDKNTSFSYGMHAPGEEVEQDGLAKELNNFEQKEQESNKDFKWETTQEDERHLEDMMDNKEANYEEFVSNFD